MRLDVINNVFGLHRIIAPFEPNAIPIKGCKVCLPEEATSVAYSTLVYDVKNGKFLLFEFGQEIYEGFSAYKSRNKDLSKLEILLTIKLDGDILMSADKKVELGIPSELINSYSKLNDSLFDKYMSKIGREVTFSV